MVPGMEMGHCYYATPVLYVEAGTLRGTEAGFHEFHGALAPIDFE